MHGPHPARRPDRLLSLLVIWTTLTTLVFWLPTVRGAFDGNSYAWAVFGFSGKGTQGPYWFPLLGSAASITLLFLGWRGAKGPFRFLLLAWHVLLAIALTVAVARDPGGFHLRGDTMGMDIDLSIGGPAFFWAWVALTTWWIVSRRNDRTDGPATAAWGRWNTRWTTMLCALLPVQFVLLRSGGPESMQDVTGVLITVAQWMLLGIAFRSRSASIRSQEPV